MSYTYSTPGTFTYSVSFDGLDPIMASIPDNDQNLISARDVRDSLLTLWWKTEDLGASFSATASQFYYTNTDPSTVSVGGLTAGSTFSNVDLQVLFDAMMYPYTPPTCIVEVVSNSDREFGSSTTVALDWSVVRAKNTILSITVDGSSETPTGYSQSGTLNTNAIQDINTTFTMSVSDGTSTITDNTVVTWSNKRYWGKVASLGTLSETQIKNLDGAGVGTGNELSTTRVQNRDDIDGSGQYLAFSWPSSFGTPTFVVNGVSNTAFTQSNSGTVVTNTYGYTASYDVWMSNTAQNSPITLFQIN